MRAFNFGGVNIRSQKDNDKSDQKYICLLDTISQINFFEKMPRNFTITTNNLSCKFNREILKQSSRTISQHLSKKNDSFHYHVNISDNFNTLTKFEQLYQGKPVTFKRSELTSNNLIAQIFDINTQFSVGKSFLECSIVEIEPNFTNLANYFKDDKSFNIITKKGQYKCNYIGVFSSKIITEYIQSNPEATTYNYDFIDEFDEFQSICDFFNFKKVTLTTNNALTIKKIAEDLDIMFISKEIDDFLDDYYDISQKFDDEQESIDQINELFDLLYNIDTRTVESVKNNIMLSKWCKTEENVLELASFIIQVINSGLLLHRYLVDLLIELNNESNDENKLKILLPFIINNFIEKFNTLSDNIKTSSFVYLLHKKGLISKDKLNKALEKLKNSEEFIDPENYTYYTFSTEKKKEDKKTILKVSPSVLLWFLPEIIELKKIKNRDLLQGNGPHVLSFINFYFDKIDLYKKMRDNGEPDDDLTSAIRHDDVDKLQSVILTKYNGATKIVIPFNIYEDFIPDCYCDLINYCAAYGAVKCFKYLLLNHNSIDTNTFKLAVYGGNTEIIKIIDQQNIPLFNDNKNSNNINKSKIKHNTKLSNFITISPIEISIQKHQYNLFDWILDKKLNKSGLNNFNFTDLINISAKNGNAHSLVELLLKCFEFTKKFFDKDNLFSNSIYERIIETLCENGFYRTVKLLMNILEPIHSKYSQESLEVVFENAITRYDYKDSIDPFGFESFIYFGYSTTSPSTLFKKYKVSNGNLSIFKLFVHSTNQDEFEYLLSYSISKNYVSIVKYFFENLLKKEKIFEIRKEGIGFILLYSLNDKNNYLFDYVMEQINLCNPEILKDFSWPISMIQKSCFSSNFKAVKYITEIVLKERPNENFLNPFMAAVSSKSFDICNYFIEKKVNILFSDEQNNVFELTNANDEIFSFVKKNTSPSIFKKICRQLFNMAINHGNKSLVKNILKEKINIDDSLISTLKNGDLDMAQIIINYCDSKDINNRINDQTALIIAVKNKFDSIVELLLNHEYFDKEDSLFNYALYISKDKKITDLLLNSKHLDINDTMFTIQNLPKETQDQSFEFDETDTLLIYSVLDKNQKMIDLIVNHPNFDKKRSQLNKAIFIAFDGCNFEAFKKLLNLIDADFNYYKFIKKNIISYITNKTFYSSQELAIEDRQLYILEILKNPIIELDSESINEVFRFLFMDSVKKSENRDFNSQNVMKLIEYDKKHNNYIDINKSMSPLYAILTEQNYKYFNFLLEIGFNPNVPDNHGVYILQYAMFLNSYSFIHSLIQSNKIDLNIKIPIIPYESNLVKKKSYGTDEKIKFEWQRDCSAKIIVKNYTSYLHLAAKCSTHILNDLIDKKLIDVNIEDDLGNTPLIDACKSKRKENILLLFKVDNLDFNHCNKEGKDALKVLNPSLTRDENESYSKDEYLELIINNFPNEASNSNQTSNRIRY